MISNCTEVILHILAQFKCFTPNKVCYSRELFKCSTLVSVQMYRCACVVFYRAIQMCYSIDLFKYITPWYCCAYFNISYIRCDYQIIYVWPCLNTRIHYVYSYKLRLCYLTEALYIWVKKIKKQTLLIILDSLWVWEWTFMFPHLHNLQVFVQFFMYSKHGCKSNDTTFHTFHSFPVSALAYAYFTYTCSIFSLSLILLYTI